MPADHASSRHRRLTVAILLAITGVPCWGETIMMPSGAKLENVDFERHVMGVVGLMGCNSGACHGSFQGRGSFRLSLFGYDLDMDHNFPRMHPMEAARSKSLEPKYGMTIYDSRSGSLGDRNGKRHVIVNDRTIQRSRKRCTTWPINASCVKSADI